MEILSGDSPEVNEWINDLLEQDFAKQKRKTLTESSFRQWVYSVIRMIASNLGYVIQDFKEFWCDISDNFMDGFNSGKKIAQRKAEQRRKIRKEL